MSSQLRDNAIAAAVYLGAVILVALPTTMLLSSLLFGTVEAIGYGSILESEVAGLVVVLLSLFVGLQLAVEVAALRLHGNAALERGGSTATVLRYVLVGTTVLAFLGVSAWIGARAVLGAIEASNVAIAGIGVAILLAVVVAAVRTGSAFAGGYRSGR